MATMFPCKGEQTRTLRERQRSAEGTVRMMKATFLSPGQTHLAVASLGEHLQVSVSGHQGSVVGASLRSKELLVRRKWNDGELPVLLTGGTSGAHQRQGDPAAAPQNLLHAAHVQIFP